MHQKQHSNLNKGILTLTYLRKHHLRNKFNCSVLHKIKVASPHIKLSFAGNKRIFFNFRQSVMQFYSKQKWIFFFEIFYFLLSSSLSVSCLQETEAKIQGYTNLRFSTLNVMSTNLDALQLYHRHAVNKGIELCSCESRLVNAIEWDMNKK